MNKVVLDGQSLTLQEVEAVARYGHEAEIAPEAAARVLKARQLVDQSVSQEKVIYGLTTGFGKFADVVISKEEAALLQKNLITSHACGVGEPLPEEVVRAMMLLRANALAKGYSGVRLETVETLVAMLNRGVHPVVPEKGSLGASGDLCPLAHMVLVMIGEGEAWYKGERMPGAQAMAAAGIKVIELDSKEGLALTNGTPAMTAVGALALLDADRAAKTADIAAALTTEALRGIPKAFDPKVHEVRGHLGQINSAENLRRILADSGLVTQPGELRVQDPYTLRCVPQVHGAIKDTIEFVYGVLSREINAATDNPLIFADDNEVISGGNFHGEPVAFAMDYLGIAISEIANIAERRLERLVNPQLSYGLPAFLTIHGGLNSGFMITQYAAAALVSENKVLAHPASVDSIPSSANQEDHVSMGTIAARKAREIVKNVENVLAIELLCAAQAIDFRGSDKLSSATRKVYELIRSRIPKVENDRVMSPDIQAVARMVHDGEILKVVEETVGLLK